MFSYKRLDVTCNYKEYFLSSSHSDTAMYMKSFKDQETYRLYEIHVILWVQVSD
jgi:hypothetical protein